MIGFSLQQSRGDTKNLGTFSKRQRDKLQLGIPAREQEVLRCDTQLAFCSGECHTGALGKEDSGSSSPEIPIAA